MEATAQPNEGPPSLHVRPSTIERISVPQTYDSLKLFVVSDIHVDYRQNLDWFSQWCEQLRASNGGSFLVMVIAGDVASSTSKVRAALQCAKKSMDEVFLVPGNHDVWVSGSMMHQGIFDSLDKLRWLESTAAELSVRTGAACLLCPNGQRLFLVPLYAWYHPSFDTEPDLPPEVTTGLFDARAPFLARWSDFRFCKWPETLCPREDFVSTSSSSTAIAEHFAMMNEGLLKDPDIQPEARLQTDIVVSFSHFLPREELCPEKRFLIEPMLPKVIGSKPLGRQVEKLRPDVHVFGHTHIPIDITLDDVRYLQWPLGSVSEQSKQCTDVAMDGPVLLFDDSKGGLLETQPTRWGEYYSAYKRDTKQTDLAPWVAAYWERFGGRSLLASKSTS